LAETDENELAFISFLLFFGIMTFQGVAADSNNFFPPLLPLTTLRLPRWRQIGRAASRAPRDTFVNQNNIPVFGLVGKEMSK
jgi:hypothetical protein